MVRTRTACPSCGKEGTMLVADDGEMIVMHEETRLFNFFNLLSSSFVKSCYIKEPVKMYRVRA